MTTPYSFPLTFILFPLLIGSGAGFSGSARANPTPTHSKKLFKVVIDAGHGGSDYGTVFENGLMQLAEKDVTLLLAKGVARELRARGFEAVLTRVEDRELALGGRTQLANRLGADLFLSIHMNSTQQVRGTGAAEGIETFILNNASDASSRRLAHLENTVISREGIKTPSQADVALILRDLRLDANLSESKRLACSIQTSLTSEPFPVVGYRSVRKRNRGVKQALFHVLLGADMPSALLEAGFLSSPHDRALILSPKGRKAMSAAIAGAIERFRATRGTPQAAATLSRCKVN